MKRIIQAVGWTAAVLGAAAAAEASEAVLKALQGEVSVRPADSREFAPARAGQKLGPDDQVRTGRGALAQIQFRSGASLLMKERSRALVRARGREVFVSFSRGEFLIGLKKKLGVKDKFTVRTPACIAAVRGTVFWGLSDDDKSSTYACFVGEVEVSAQGRSVVLSPGQKLKVAAGGAPGKPGPADIPAGTVDAFAINGDLLGVDRLLRKE
jgi:hypothetical protein